MNFFLFYCSLNGSYALIFSKHFDQILSSIVAPLASFKARLIISNQVSAFTYFSSNKPSSFQAFITVQKPLYLNVPLNTLVASFKPYKSLYVTLFRFG